MQLFSVDALRKTQITFFPLLPAQTKWPKQKNSCFKMRPIDQLYIKLGYDPLPDGLP